MPPYSMERSILEGDMQIKAIFQYVENNTENLDAYGWKKPYGKGSTGSDWF